MPLKQHDTGDGLFFHLVLCLAIWSFGFVVHLIRGSPTFQPIAVLGGVIWSTGNLLVIDLCLSCFPVRFSWCKSVLILAQVVPIVSRIGLSLGLLIWGSTAMLAGAIRVRR